MKRVARRKAIAEVIATLIMLAAATLFTSIVLYWGLSIQGQSLQNYGGALFKSNNQVTEELSIDSTYFSAASTTPKLYTSTLYVRNFGDSPIKIAAVHIKNLQTGATPAGIDCEVTSPTLHPTVLARSMGPGTPPAGILLTSQQCTPTGALAGTFPLCWEGQSISIQVNTVSGTSYQKNYVIPNPSITIQTTPPPTFNVSPANPSATFTIVNNGPVAMSIGSILMTGAVSNGGSGFTGSVTGTIPCGGSATVVASDGSTWSVSPNTSTTINSGASATVTLSWSSGARSTTNIGSTNSITVQVIATGGSFSTATCTTTGTCTTP